MARRSPQTAVKRAREQALREKRERKQAKKEARAIEKLNESTEQPLDPEAEALDETEDGDAEP